MNKEHFEQSINAMQEYHTSELREAAQARAIKNHSVQAEYARELELVRDQVRRLTSELEDEKAGKDHALAQLAVSVLCPLPLPYSASFSSVAILLPPREILVIC